MTSVHKALSDICQLQVGTLWETVLARLGKVFSLFDLRCHMQFGATRALNQPLLGKGFGSTQRKKKWEIITQPRFSVSA